MIVRNQTKNVDLADQSKVADNFLSRLKGLLGSPSLTEGQGLLLKNEKSIHTLFMTFPIDVVYIDRDLSIIKIDHNMPPYRLGKYVTKSAYILELPAGTIEATETAVGDKVSFNA